MQRVRELAAACPDADTTLACRTIEVSTTPHWCVHTDLSELRASGVSAYPTGKQSPGSRLSN
jgi:hypothetical protein